MEVTNHKTLLAWLGREGLPQSKNSYNIDSTFKICERDLDHLASLHRPHVVLETLRLTLLNIEEYDFCSFYPSIYKHLIFSTNTTSKNIKKVQESFRLVFNRANVCHVGQKKKILNIIYGLFHCPYSIFFNPKLAKLIRIIGSMIIKKLSRIHGDRVVYCCVDSIFLVQDKNNDSINDKFLLECPIDLHITRRNVFRNIIFYSKLSYYAETMDGIVIERGPRKRTDTFGYESRISRRYDTAPAQRPTTKKTNLFPDNSTKALINLYRSLK